MGGLGANVGKYQGTHMQAETSMHTHHTPQSIHYFYVIFSRLVVCLCDTASFASVSFALKLVVKQSFLLLLRFSRKSLCFVALRLTQKSSLI